MVGLGVLSPQVSGGQKAESGGKTGGFMKTLSQEMFEIEVQYCDPDDCLQDCMESGYNNCTAVVTGWW